MGYLATFEHVPGSRVMKNLPSNRGSGPMEIIQWPGGRPRYLYHKKLTGEVEPQEEPTRVPDPPPQDPPKPPIAVQPKCVRNAEPAKPNTSAQAAVDPLRNRFFNCPQGKVLLFVFFIDAKDLMNKTLAKQHSPEALAEAEEIGVPLEPNDPPSYYKAA